MDGDPFALRPELTAPALWCPACRRGPPAFAVARSVAAYEGGLREAICALKFHRKPAIAEPLGQLLARFAPQEVFHMVDAIVPVPLHQDRFAQRGFNQSELLAKHVATAAAAPCLPDALRRVRQEAAQAELGAVDRWHNVDGAFAPGLRVRGTVLLVDDVFSTGATAAACSRALAEAGAERVVVLTLARAVLRGYHGALLRPPIPHLAAQKQPLPP